MITLPKTPPLPKSSLGLKLDLPAAIYKMSDSSFPDSCAVAQLNAHSGFTARYA